MQADDQSFVDIMEIYDHYFKRSQMEEEAKTDHRRPRNGQRRHLRLSNI